MMKKIQHAATLFCHGIPEKSFIVLAFGYPFIL